MGPNFMKDFDLGRILVALAAAGFVAGVVVGVPVVLLAVWLARHISVSWN